MVEIASCEWTLNGCREDLGVFSEELHEVSIASISLIDMAEKSRHSKTEKSKHSETEKSGPNRRQKYLRETGKQQSF